MKVAVSAQGQDMNALVDPRLGRAQQFLLIDTESMEFDVLDNPNVGAMGGAGIQTAQLLASKGVQAVITGNCGPNAFATLQAAGIQVYIGASGTIQQALDRYKQGHLQLANQPNVGGHVGTPRGAGRGMGMGGNVVDVSTSPGSADILSAPCAGKMPALPGLSQQYWGWGGW